MLNRRIALLAIGAVILLATSAHAASHVFVRIDVGPPAPVYVPAPPPPPPPVVVYAPPPVPYGYVWRPGYYVWTGYGYRLVPGAWVRPPYAHAVWVAPRWEKHRHGHGGQWVDGYWRR